MLSDYQWAQVTHMVMTQYGYKVAVLKFGIEATNAVTKELTQVHNREAFSPQDAHSLSYEQRRRALEPIMHVKHKRDDSKKARLCAGGRKQRLTMRKDETTSPTVYTDSVFITAAIEASENRRTAVVDLPGTYLSDNMDDEEEVLMVMRGDLAEMMALAAPEVYRKYVAITPDGKKGTLRQTVQGAVRMPQVSAPFLPQTMERPAH